MVELKVNELIYNDRPLKSALDRRFDRPPIQK